jgi:hypothetical protein
MIFDRYQGGGGELLLALAIADHAHDDGTHVFPSIKSMSAKTRQSERTVQYQLRSMEEKGWLELVADEKGGRGRCREYRINAEWIKGADIAPMKIKGATDDIKGATDDIKGATDDIKGATAIAPESLESSLTIKESLKEKINKKENIPKLEVVPKPSKIHKPEIDPEIKKLLHDVDDQVIKDFVILRKQRKAPITETAVAGIRREAAKANISLQDALIECCSSNWQGFKAAWYQKAQQQQPVYQSRAQVGMNAAQAFYRGIHNTERCINEEFIEHESLIN